MWYGMEVVGLSFRCKQIPEITDWQRGCVEGKGGLTKLLINPGKRVRTNLVNSPENRACVRVDLLFYSIYKKYDLLQMVAGVSG